MCTYIAASLSDSTDEGWDLLAGTEISDAWCEKSQNIKYCADGGNNTGSCYKQITVFIKEKADPTCLNSQLVVECLHFITL